MNKKERFSAFLDFIRPFFVPDEGMALCTALDGMCYFDAPASTRFHGAYAGGLFEHSLAVTKHLVDLTRELGLKWASDRAPVIIGLLHDLCKCDLYLPNGEGGYFYNTDADKRHGVKSKEIARKLLPDLTDEEALCIEYHMGAYMGKESWAALDEAIEACPNVLWTHTADMMAAKFDGT